MSARPPARERGAGLSEAKRRLLEKYLRGESPRREEGDGSIPRRPPGCAVPLSACQQPIWLHSRLAPTLPLYNEAMTVHRSGPLDVAALEWSLGEILRRHEAWRTTIDARDGEPLQVVSPAPRVTLEVHDLTDLPPAGREPEALRLLTEDARRPFDPATGPLVRFRLVRLAEDRHRLEMVLHQIVFDGVSAFSIFLPELTALYAARVAGRPSPLPEPAIQYGDFALWQGQERAARSRGALDYWERSLAGAPSALDLPTDRPRPPVASFRGGQILFSLPAGLGERLRALSRGRGASLFMTLLASFAILLNRYTGQEDIVVGTVTTRRDRPELEGVMGLFLNTLALRTRLAGEDTFLEVLARVRDATLGGLVHGDAPIGEVVSRLRPERDASRNPLFQAMLVLEPPLDEPPPGWSLTQMEADTGIARVDLHLQIDDRPSGILGRLRYAADLFERPTAERMVERFLVLLDGIASDPEARVAALPVLTPAERCGSPGPVQPPGAARGTVAFGREEIETSIVDRFARMAREHPRRMAIRDDSGDLTYAGLDERSSRVATAIRAGAEAGPGRIALLLEHDAGLAAGILGALKAGETYVPLDPSHPPSRLSHIVADADARGVLACARHAGLATSLAGGRKVLILEEIARGAAAAGRGRPPSADSPAYILYTSGSTGWPKGVLQSHRNVLHFIQAYTANLGLSAADRLTLLSSYSVDAAVMDIFGALLNGAALRPIDAKEAGFGGLLERLGRDGVTVYHSTPTVFRHLAAATGEEPLPASVRLVVLGGEEVRREDLEIHRRIAPPRCVFVNGLGPTESTVSLQQLYDHGSRLERATVPVGRPVTETEVLLLSPRGVPGQIFGEIGIRSRHVALGYWRNPILTREAFLPDPEGGERRIYRTGDLGRLLADGSIEFAGRRDAQVKIRGFRVEPGEIEDALSRHPDVREAAVAVREISPGEKRLAAFWVARRQPAPADDVLRRHLRERLPDSMIPSVFVRLDALPLTPSGKIDRRALPSLPEGPPEGGPPSAPPSDALEIRLARLWEEILGAGPIGREEHFFDLGGDSLLAVRLVAAIEKELGRRVPPATLLAAPTLGALADVLRGAGSEAAWSSLVALRASGRRPPIFCVHGHSGEVLFYRDLCRRLGPDQPFFALQAQGLSGGPPHRTIEAMAARYLKEIRTVQGRGPYRIGGYCLGAIVAFEMAQQLAARGDEVALLALFVGHDARLHAPFGRLRRRLSLQRARARSVPDRDRLGYFAGWGRDVARRLASSARSSFLRSLYRVVDLLPRAPLRLPGGVEEISLHAARRYRPRRFPGRMTVFLSGDLPAGTPLDPVRHLDGLEAREMEVVRVPGVTDTMMQEPHASVLAARVRDRLEAVDPEAGDHRGAIAGFP